MVGQVAMKKWAASVVLLVPAVGSGTLSAGTADPPSLSRTSSDDRGYSGDDRLVGTRAQT